MSPKSIFELSCLLSNGYIVHVYAFLIVLICISFVYFILYVSAHQSNSFRVKSQNNVKVRKALQGGIPNNKQLFGFSERKKKL